MKTFLIEADGVARLPKAGGSGIGRVTFQGPEAVCRALPEWLPAPPVARPVEKPAPRRNQLWIVRTSDSLGERILFALLIVAAVVAIGYGFSSLLGLVENWAGFNSTVGQLIQ